MTPALLSFDLGTTRLKVALFDRRGRLLGSRAARHREYTDGERAWQDADEWWASAVALGRDLCSNTDAQVEAVATSGRGNAAVFIGRDGTVIGQPWSDARHRDALRSLRAAGPVATNYAATLLAKKQWFVRNESQRARGLRHVLYAKDLLVYRLTGRAITDPSSGPDALTWPSELVDAANAAGLVPEVGLPWQLAGALQPAAAKALGLPSGVPVAVGAHDGVCANYGAGVGMPGGYAITLGTNTVVRATSATAPIGANRFYCLPPERHAIGANGQLVGRSPDWFLDLVYGADDRHRARHLRAADRAAALRPMGAEGVRFLPYLAPTIAPEVRNRAFGQFHGLRANHDRSVLYRAVLEGTVFVVDRLFDQVRGWCGEPDVIRLTGSGATSDVWCRMLAAALGRPLQAADGAVEGRGAAMCAAVALGWYQAIDTASLAMAVVRKTFEPTTDEHAAWQPLLANYRDLDARVRALEAT